MSGCEWGCPCDDDAFCQENVMIVCQMGDYDMGNQYFDNPSNFSYIISVDGTYEEAFVSSCSSISHFFSFDKVR